MKPNPDTGFMFAAPQGPYAGVDEAGRGPLAGPVVVAAVILDTERPIPGLDDSKRLTAEHRETLEAQIRRSALAWKVVTIDVSTIDELNILGATLLGMRRALDGLNPQPELALIDGNHNPKAKCPCHPVVRGDQLHPEISAASILAKVHRDRLMRELHDEFPAYGFDRHKGYPTPEHRRILAEIGPCCHHRKSFAPVRASLM